MVIRVINRVKRVDQRTVPILYNRILLFGVLISSQTHVLWKSGGNLVSVCLYSVVNGFEWVWMGSLCMNIQLMLEFLKALFLVLLFSYNKFMSFLMTLYVILVFMLVHYSLPFCLKYDLVSDVQRKVELASELKSDLTRGCRPVRNWRLTSIIKKLNFFCLTGLITQVLWTWKWKVCSWRKIVF